VGTTPPAVTRAALLRNERLPSVAIWIASLQKEILIKSYVGAAAWQLGAKANRKQVDAEGGAADRRTPPDAVCSPPLVINAIPASNRMRRAFTRRAYSLLASISFTVAPLVEAITARLPVLPPRAPSAKSVNHVVWD
jgi:hypothetical protein